MSGEKKIIEKLFLANHEPVTRVTLIVTGAVGLAAYIEQVLANRQHDHLLIISTHSFA
jgi:hypothetical protein